jgi:hypothetical protein
MLSTLQILELESGSSRITICFSGTPPDFSGKRYDVFTAFRNENEQILCAYCAKDGIADLFRIALSEPFVSRMASIDLGVGWVALNSFGYYNDNYLMTYRPDTGRFGFFVLGRDLGIRGKYTYVRFHAPAMSRNFTMVQPFVAGGRVLFMGYGIESGSVCLYRVEATVSSRAGTPPIAAHTVWDHLWAPGWTRFAFFHLGGEAFFLKTNTKFPNVNIDHVLDDPATGTSEVCSQMDLPDAQELSLVATFQRDQGHPHFAAYRPNGLLVAYRIHSNCLGWAALCRTEVTTNAHALVPVAINDRQFFLLLAES